MSNHHGCPAQEDEEHRNIYVIDEKASLTRPLKTPVHVISTEQGSCWRTFLLFYRLHWFFKRLNLLSISYLILDSWANESFCLIGDGFVFRGIKKYKHCPYTNALVHIL